MVLLHEEEEEPNGRQSNNEAQRPHIRQKPQKAHLIGEFVVVL